MDEISFAGRVAVVTGAGTGLGRSYALELARRGASVVVNDLGGDGRGHGSAEAPADAVAAQIISAGGAAVASYDSVATRAGGRAIIERALDAFGRLDILIANAGILRSARFDEMDDDDIDTVIDVHLKGGFYVGQPAFAAMKRQGYGRILFTASSSGLFGHPWQASYGAAKAGIVGLTNVVALEGKDFGVQCNAIMPNARTRLADTVDFAWGSEVREVKAALSDLLAMPAAGMERLDPEWVMPLALHLVSEESTATHRIFSACSGHFAEVFIGAVRGWSAVSKLSVEDIGAHWDQICDRAQFHEPDSVYHEAAHARRMIARLEQPNAAL